MCRESPEKLNGDAFPDGIKTGTGNKFSRVVREIA